MSYQDYQIYDLFGSVSQLRVHSRISLNLNSLAQTLYVYTRSIEIIVIALFQDTRLLVDILA